MSAGSVVNPAKVRAPMPKGVVKGYQNLAIGPRPGGRTLGRELDARKNAAFFKKDQMKTGASL
jgi:hypothetical protein